MTSATKARTKTRLKPLPILLNYNNKNNNNNNNNNNTNNNNKEEEEEEGKMKGTKLTRMGKERNKKRGREGELSYAQKVKDHYEKTGA